MHNPTAPNQYAPRTFKINTRQYQKYLNTHCSIIYVCISAGECGCEDRIGTGPPLARTKFIYVDLGYWAISGSIHPKGDPACVQSGRRPGEERGVRVGQLKRLEEPHQVGSFSSQA